MTTKDNCFGRSGYLEVLSRRIRNFKDGYRQNLAVIGDELIGKTSILFRMLAGLDDNRLIMLYLEVRSEPLSSFAQRFIGVLLYNFLLNSGYPLKEDLDFLIKRSCGYIPHTVEKINAILAALKKRKKNNILSELFSLTEIIHQETGKSCVVILDEFHNLEGVGVKKVYRDWAKLLVLQKNTMYIIASSFKFKTKSLLSKELSTLFGNFETVMIEPFDIKTSEAYLERCLSGAALTRGLKNFIIHLTGGYPFYLRLISEAVIKNTQSTLSDILEDILFEPSGILNQRFSNYLKRFLDLPQSQDYISILYLVSSGHNRFNDIAAMLHKPKKDLRTRVNHLLGVDAVTRLGDFLKINDRVFAFWMRFVYQEKLNSLTFDAKNQKAAFRDKISEMINEFIINSQKPLIERLAELLRLFENDTLQIDNKRIRLTHFREIKPLEFNNRSLREGLIGRSGDGTWLLGLKQESITEDDICAFARECKKYHKNLERKIILTSAEVDVNARLRAMEEKIATWDLDNINQLFDLFYKPRLIA
ncbi:MAG: hypothetical protein WC469_04195 [Candidatus Omnitrophota bacterium]